MMISCKKAGELIEKKLSRRISPIEKIELAIHTTVCNACRSYEKQSQLINDALTHNYSSLEEKAPDHLKKKLLKKFK